MLGRDSCWVVQTDLCVGPQRPELGRWCHSTASGFPRGRGGRGQRDVHGHAGFGPRLWSVDTYLGTYNGFFLRTTDGHFRTIAGESAIDSAIASGAVNGLGDSGIEAWVTDDYSYVIVLLQWPVPGKPSDPIVHTSKAQWVVTDLRDETVMISDNFAPVPPLCGAATGLVPGGGSTPPAHVTAGCGGSTYSLVPLTAQATKVSG